MKKTLQVLTRFILFLVFGAFILYALLWLSEIFIKELPIEALNCGVTFSKPYAEELNIDWKKAYLEILDDLKIKRIRTLAYWTEVEPESGEFSFEALDFQINEAAVRGVDIILAVGQKLPRWPECHIPKWVEENREELLLTYIKTVVERYKDVDAISHWQIENEPFLITFGVCPKFDEELLDREIELVRSIDDRPILITDSGELGDWIRARKRGDVFGTTMYRVIWKDNIGYFRWPLPSTWFKFKDLISRPFAESEGNKIIVIEMQAEAWGPDPIPFIGLEEQFKSMSFEDFKNNIDYARRAGIKDIYFWGVEWWYWLRDQGDPRFWEYSKQLF